MENIAAMRALFLNVPGIKNDKVDPLLAAVEKRFKNITTDKEFGVSFIASASVTLSLLIFVMFFQLALLCLYLPSGTNYTITEDECVELFSEESSSGSKDGITEEELTEMERKLNTKLSIQQTEEFMEILRKFRVGNSLSEMSQGTVNKLNRYTILLMDEFLMIYWIFQLDMFVYGMFIPSRKPSDLTARRLLVQLWKNDLDKAAVNEIKKQAEWTTQPI